MPGSRSSRSPTARRSSPRSRRGRTRPTLLRLDTAVSRLKVELGVTAAEVAADTEAGPVARAFVAYEARGRGQRRARLR